MRAVLFACSAISAPLQPSWVSFFFFFFLHSCRMLKPSLDPGQLCHILSTAVTHFLFPFQINLLTSFTAFTYKKNKTRRLSFQAAIPRTRYWSDGKICGRWQSLCSHTAALWFLPFLLLFQLVYRVYLHVPRVMREE